MQEYLPGAAARTPRKAARPPEQPKKTAAFDGEEPVVEVGLPSAEPVLVLLQFLDNAAQMIGQGELFGGGCISEAFDFTAKIFNHESNFFDFSGLSMEASGRRAKKYLRGTSRNMPLGSIIYQTVVEEVSEDA